MIISIYQVNMDRDKNRVAFMDYEHLNQFQGSPEVDASIYDSVFTGEVDAENLEDVYRIFNIEHPAGYRGRSLSVSDIVEIKESDQATPGFYFCDDIGFKKTVFTPPEKPEKEMLRVLLVEPGKLAREAYIGTELSDLQAAVEGDIEQFSPFEDEISIICNEEGKISGLPLNRAVYAQPSETELSYGELVSQFRDAEKDGKHMTGYVIFTEDSFDKPYPLEARTYAISSNNKAFQAGMGGYSIYGSSLDGSDVCVRLEGYMANEQGGKDGWKIERCYTKGNEKEILDIVAGKFFVISTPSESEKFMSLSDEQMRKYMKLFRYPEQFFRSGGEIQAVQFNPEKNKNHER